MELAAWVWWAVSAIASAVFSVVWFLVGGWVVTLAQLAVLIGIVFAYKFGWRRAPLEVASRMRAMGSRVWPWLRQREPRRDEAPSLRQGLERQNGRQFGDINLSTLMSIAALFGLGALFVVQT
jgi:hypothetical protein